MPGSGNQWHAKGDVATDEWLIECKRTDKKSFRLEHDMLRKHTLLALKAGKDPLVQVEFGKQRYAIVPWSVWKRLTR